MLQVLEMLRKVILTGAVLIIPDGYEQGRLLVAQLVSIMFLTLQV